MNGERYEARRWDGGPECWWIVFDHETQSPTGRLFQTWAGAHQHAGELNRSRPTPERDRLDWARQQLAELSPGVPRSARSGRAELDELLKRAVAAFNAMSPEEQEAHLRAQRESWVRGEMALGKLERSTTKTAQPAEPAPHCARCGHLDAALWGVIQAKSLDDAHAIAIAARGKSDV